MLSTDVSMRKYLIILSLLFLSVASSAQIIFGTFAPYHLNVEGKSITWVGDSYFFGQNATSSENKFTTIVTTALGGFENNLGVSGRAMQGNGCSGGVLDKTIIPVYNPITSGALIIGLGTNDAGQNNGVSTTAAFELKYDSVLTYATETRGWPLNRIVLLTLYYVIDYSSWVGFGTCDVSVAATEARFLDYVQKTKDIGSAWGIRVIDVYNFVKPIAASVLDTDDLHPTDAGHALIADFLIEQL